MKRRNKKPSKSDHTDHVEELKAFVERKQAENKALEKLLKEIAFKSSNKHRK